MIRLIGVVVGTDYLYVWVVGPLGTKAADQIIASDLTKDRKHPIILQTFGIQVLTMSPLRGHSVLKEWGADCKSKKGIWTINPEGSHLFRKGGACDHET